MVVTHYHKMQALFDSGKVIPRFLPDRVSQLVAVYLAFVRPFRDRLDVETGGPAPSDWICRRRTRDVWRRCAMRCARI